MSESQATSSDFAGRVAVVTGAARGIGRAVSASLASRGCLVAALDVDGVALERLAVELPGVHPRVCDVRDGAAVHRHIAEVASSLGLPRFLANVAGVMHTARAAEVTDEQWRHCFDVNATAVMFACRAVVPFMMQAGAGAIVTVSSNAASTPRTDLAPYAASKAAATAYTRCLGLQLAPHGIRCNVVSPGTTNTDMVAAMYVSEEARGRVLRGDLEGFRCGIPLGRIAEPEDVARAVVFLLSDEARHITLHDLRVDGGATLGTG